MNKNLSDSAIIQARAILNIAIANAEIVKAQASYDIAVARDAELSKAREVKLSKTKITYFAYIERVCGQKVNKDIQTINEILNNDVDINKPEGLYEDVYSPNILFEYTNLLSRNGLLELIKELEKTLPEKREQFNRYLNAR